MKAKILLSLLSIFCCVNAMADETSDKYLSRLSTKLKSAKNYQMNIVISASGEFKNIEGNCTVSGDKYYFNIYDSEVFYNGKARYTYSKKNNEVIIEKASANASIFDNPIKLFDLYNDRFSHSFLGEELLGERKTAKIGLKDKNNELGDITLYVDMENYEPVKMISNMQDMEIKVDVKSIKFNTDIKESTFNFDKSKYPKIEVIDLR